MCYAHHRPTLRGVQELLSQQQALQGLVARNQERAHNGCDAKSPSESRIALPFMVAVVPSCPSVSVEVKISDAQDYAHFDFAGCVPCCPWPALPADRLTLCHRSVGSTVVSRIIVIQAKGHS